jgi:MFS family permease
MNETEQPSMIAGVRSMPPAAWVLFGGSFVNRFGSFVVPFLVIYFTRSGYGIAAAGAGAASYGFGHLVASILGGHLADHFGRRNTIALSMFSSAAAMLMLSQVHGLALMTLCTFLSGVAAELYRPASHALIGDLVPENQRVTAFALYRFAVNLGFAAGPATAGFLADRSFFYLFLGDALTSLAYGVIALLFLPHGHRIERHEREPFFEGFRFALRDRRFVFFLIATACMTFPDFQMGSTMALHVTEHGFSAAQYGALISLNGVLIILFELLLISFTRKLPGHAVIAVGYSCVGIGFALTGFATTMPALMLTVVIWTVGEMVASPIAGAYVSRIAPQRYRGRYMGLFVLMLSIGMTLGPLVGTAIYAHHPAALWSLCGVLGIIAGMLALRSAPPRNAAAEIVTRSSD